MNRYEFCYLGHDRRPMFAIMWDDSMLSACERLLCRAMEASELTFTSQGNCILKGWNEGEWISVKETTDEASSTFSCGDNAPEVAAPRTVVLNLGGLDLSKAR